MFFCRTTSCRCQQMLPRLPFCKNNLHVLAYSECDLVTVLLYSIHSNIRESIDEFVQFVLMRKYLHITDHMPFSHKVGQVEISLSFQFIHFARSDLFALSTHVECHKYHSDRTSFQVDHLEGYDYTIYPPQIYRWIYVSG